MHLFGKQFLLVIAFFHVKATIAFTGVFRTRHIALGYSGRNKNLLRARCADVEIASTSVAGVDPDSHGKVNQDVCFYSKSERFVYCGVLDGHGKKGHVLNEFLGSYIPTKLEEQLKELEECEYEAESMDKLLVEAFESAQYAARMNESVPAGRSGTTCVVTIVDLKTGVVYTGNVGDSRAIIAINEDSIWKALPLSEETTTACEKERSRIEEGEGRIDSGGNVWYGPVGIAMTRALGDAVMKRAGVIPTPQITHFDLNEKLGKSNNGNQVYIILASDGIYDVMGNTETIEFLHRQIQSKLSLDEGCAMLVKEARRKWQGGLPLDVRIDDCTAVAMSFRVIK